jgi:hypothetical protein
VGEVPPTTRAEPASLPDPDGEVPEDGTDGDGHGTGGTGGIGGSPAEAVAAPGEPERSGVTSELLLGLEVAALAALTFSRPVLDTFGRSPESFIARQATATDIVLFGLVVAFAPALAFAALGSLTRLFGAPARRWSHLVLVMVLGGLAAWRFGRDVTGWPNDATKLLLAGFLVGPLLALLRWRAPATGTFLRYAGAASVIFLVQFLVMSPAADMVFAGPPGVDAAVDDQVAAGLGDDPPSVVVVVLDAFPTASLLDGSGQVDREVYPNIAALADTSTWYRNATSVAAYTDRAVPALLTGRYPGSERPRSPDPENLFTLLGGSYDLHVKEQITQLCPEDLCPRDASAGVGRLVGDAATWWQGTGSDEPRDEFDLPAVLEEGRYDTAEEWIDDLRVSPGGRPDLTFLHVVLPHAPWQFTDDGTLYDMQTDLPIGSAGLGWSQAGTDVGQQRHLLQARAADRLVGQLLDRLRDDDAFDDSLVVLTADHGESFLPDSLGRGLDAENIPYIMWTPLFVKTPGQTRASVDDGNIEAVDVTPTIADALGVEIPWDVDGLPVAEAVAERDPDTKRFADDEGHEIHAADGEDLLEIDGSDHFPTVLAADAVSARGPDAIWKRTPYGELFGRSPGAAGVGDPADGTLSVEHPGELRIDTGEPLPLEVIGHTDLDVGTTVALALNGTIGAVTTVEPWFDAGGGPLVHGMMPPDLFVDGVNEVTAYVVEGPPGDETLRPLAVELP